MTIRLNILSGSRKHDLLSADFKGGLRKGVLELPQFKKNMQGLDRLVSKVVIDVQKEVVRDLYKNVVEVTPVLTGRARRNWNVSVNVPLTSTTEDVAGVRLTGTPVTSEERSRVNAALKLLDTLPLGQTVFVSNHLLYVVGLDAGTSQKAPLGIREVSLTRTLGDFGL